MERLDSGAPVACSLNDADFQIRRSYARQRLIPKITNLDRVNNGLIFRFDAEPELMDDVNMFIDLERKCCGFLTFTIIPNSNSIGKVVELKIEGPPEAALTLEMFAKAAESTTSNQNIASGRNDGGCGGACRKITDVLSSDNLTLKLWFTHIRRAGWSGIIMGSLAVLACGLPILLAALGFGGLSAGAIAFQPPQFVETFAIIAGLLGVLCLIVLYIGKMLKRRRSVA